MGGGGGGGGRGGGREASWVKRRRRRNEELATGLRVSQLQLYMTVGDERKKEEKRREI